jgi:hypothetical protein
MKKNLLLIASIIGFTLASNAQNVEVDKVESDGTRFIRTEYSSIYKKMFSGGSIALCCDYNSQSNDTTYYIIMKLTEQNPPQIDKGRKLLVKLNNGAIITLENATKIGPLDIETWKGAYNMVEYRVYPMYQVSRLDLLRMINEDVEKIRIETDEAENLDYTIKRSKMSDALYEGLKNIEQALSVKKDIYSDF